jgi:hypothetical protein
MKRPRYILWGLCLGGLFLFALDPIRLDDFFLYLSFGRRFFDLGEFGATDPYIFSIQDYHWDVMHEWLSYLYYYGVYFMGGYWAVIVFRALWVCCAGLILLVTCKRSNLSSFGTSFIFISSFLAASPRCFKDRSSFFSDLFTAALIFCLTDENFLSKNSKIKWFLPLGFLLWVQLHPGYVVAWAILGLFLISNWLTWGARQRKEWLAITVLSGLITLLNPNGIGVILWPINMIFSGDWSVFGRINEWVPSLKADFLPVGYKVYLCAYMVFAVTLTIFSFRRNRFMTGVALLLCYLGLSSSRFLSLSVIGLGVLAADSLRSIAWVNLNRVQMNLAALVLSIAVFLCSLIWPGHGVRFIISGNPLHPSVPEEGVRFLTTLPPGNTFNEWDLGGYLIWMMDGRQKIGAHGFISDPNLVHDKIYRFSVSKEGWNEIILGGKVEYFIIRRQTYELSHQAAWIRELDGPEWLKIYTDRAAVIFRKNHGS